MPEHLRVPEVYQFFLDQHRISVILMPGLALIAAVSQALPLARLPRVRMVIGMRKDRDQSI
ncbi:hypothetical protein D3C76_1761710 [compost metagenome]